ncbi:hypothetical protein VIBNISOn1_90002 [Vibrio nigripulchritudo SOn1]|uniref:Transposase n=1 Tax=Vibrio nigripulchritudo SOn1 TaxID=1238450 RepID=A0AAV2VZE2_9VIBR|nr:hypothetical protein VIBNISOn1_90002 [Vibrio nigripulchritudo SOn1]
MKRTFHAGEFVRHQFTVFDGLVSHGLTSFYSVLMSAVYRVAVHHDGLRLRYSPKMKNVR